MPNFPKEETPLLAGNKETETRLQARNMISGLLLLPSGYAVAEFNYYRQFLVYPEDFHTYSFLKEILGKPNLSPEIFQFLQNGGDFFSGYAGALGVKILVDGFDYFQSGYSQRRIPERLKSAFSFVSAISAVSLVELGLLGNWGTADLGDIPAGIAGALAFLGANYLARKLGGKMVNPSVPPIQPKIAG